MFNRGYGLEGVMRRAKPFCMSEKYKDTGRDLEKEETGWETVSWVTAGDKGSLVAKGIYLKSTLSSRPCNLST